MVFCSKGCMHGALLHGFLQGPLVACMHAALLNEEAGSGSHSIDGSHTHGTGPAQVVAVSIRYMTNDNSDVIGQAGVVKG